MEGKTEISVHEVRIWNAIQAAGGWLSAKEVADISGVAGRTARLHLVKLSRLGLVDVAKLFPGYRYKINASDGKQNAAYCVRIAKAGEIFGLSKKETT